MVWCESFNSPENLQLYQVNEHIVWEMFGQIFSIIYKNIVVAGYRSHCYFPKAWHGEYFHLGYNSPLVVIDSSISGKGRCVENFGSHFVMEDEEYGEKCWRCMTMYRKHQNVLSYKESKLSLLIEPVKAVLN